MQTARRPFSRALLRAGRSIAARMPIMAMTTRSSINVKAAGLADLPRKMTPELLRILSVRPPSKCHCLELITKQTGSKVKTLYFEFRTDIPRHCLLVIYDPKSVAEFNQTRTRRHVTSSPDTKLGNACQSRIARFSAYWFPFSAF